MTCPGRGCGILDQQDHQGNHNYSDELHFIGKAFDGWLSWIVGAYYDQFQQADTRTSTSSTSR